MPESPWELDAVGHGDCSSFAVRYHLLGTVPFDDFLLLQQRLVCEASEHDDGHITVVLCEHPPLISVGRGGSRGHIRLTNEQLRRRQLAVRWISRGGGCVLHTPGQMAVYPIVSLRWHGWTVGEYLQRFRTAVTATLDQLSVKHQWHAALGGIWGRSGQLVSWGVAVRNWITCHGAHFNINPLMVNYGFVDVADPCAVGLRLKSTMGCLFAERRQALSVAKVRATLIPHLAAAFGTERYYLFTGHNLMTTKGSYRDARHCAS